MLSRLLLAAAAAAAAALAELLLLLLTLLLLLPFCEEFPPFEGGEFSSGGDSGGERVPGEERDMYRTEMFERGSNPQKYFLFFACAASAVDRSALGFLLLQKPRIYF